MRRGYLRFAVLFLLARAAVCSGVSDTTDFDSVLCPRLNGLTPAGAVAPGESFEAPEGFVILLTSVHNTRSSRPLQHVWIEGEATVSTIHVRGNGPDWRVYSSVNVREKLGNWRVELHRSDGRVVQTLYFLVRAEGAKTWIYPLSDQVHTSQSLALASDKPAAVEVLPTEVQAAVETEKKAQAEALVAAREAADAKAAELKAQWEKEQNETKVRAQIDAWVKEDAEAKAKKEAKAEAEAKAKAQAEVEAQSRAKEKAEAAALAKAEEEAREAARKAREAADREVRKAREEAEAKAREEEWARADARTRAEEREKREKERPKKPPAPRPDEIRMETRFFSSHIEGTDLANGATGNLDTGLGLALDLAWRQNWTKALRTSLGIQLSHLGATETMAGSPDQAVTRTLFSTGAGATLDVARDLDVGVALSYRQALYFEEAAPGTLGPQTGFLPRLDLTGGYTLPYHPSDVTFRTEFGLIALHASANSAPAVTNLGFRLHFEASHAFESGIAHVGLFFSQRQQSAAFVDGSRRDFGLSVAYSFGVARP